MIIMLFIGLNMLAMTLDHYHQNEMWSFALDNLNMGFIVVFSSECILKIFALRLYYFKEPWNMFDFVVVVLSILGEYCPTFIGIIKQSLYIYWLYKFDAILYIFQVLFWVTWLKPILYLQHCSESFGWRKLEEFCDLSREQEAFERCCLHWQCRCQPCLISVSYFSSWCSYLPYLECLSLWTSNIEELLIVCIILRRLDNLWFYYFKCQPVPAGMVS